MHIIFACSQLKIERLKTAIAGARGHDLYLDFVQGLYGKADSFPDAELRLANESIHVHRFLLRAVFPKLCELQ